MASTTRALSRAALLLCRRPPRGRPQIAFRQRNPAMRQTRFFSASSINRLPEDPPVPPEPKDLTPEDIEELPEYSPENFTPEEKRMYEMMSPEERALFDEENRRFVAMFNDPKERASDFQEIEQSAAIIEREEPMRFEDIKEKNLGFWAEDEPDELGIVEDGDEEFNDDEITSMAHAELELHREIREYMRIAAWDMPLLSKLAKPFSLPSESQLLRFRYTTYMGEQHPAENKVVVELSSKDLVPKYLTEDQRQTFLKLVGPRYNPDTDIVRMSSEKFSSRAENKRYLGDLVNNLIKAAKEGDSFADIPLDLRHHKPKQRIEFPESWKMTEERRRQLQAEREARKREQEHAAIVDGKEVLEHAIRTIPSLTQMPLLGGAEKATAKVPVGAKKGQAQKLRRL